MILEAVQCVFIKFNKYSSLFCPIEKEELLDFRIEKQASASIKPDSQLLK